VREVLAEIEADEVPELVVVNKADAADPAVLDRIHRHEPGAVCVSALTGEGLDELVRAIADVLPRPDLHVSLLVPYKRGDLVSRLHEVGRIESVQHVEAGTLISAWVPEWLGGEVRGFAVDATAMTPAG